MTRDEARKLWSDYRERWIMGVYCEQDAPETEAMIQAILQADAAARGECLKLAEAEYDCSSEVRWAAIRDAIRATIKKDGA